MANEKSQAVLATIQAVGAVTVAGILAVWIIASISAGDRPIPVELQGCYHSEQQSLKVEERYIFANGSPTASAEVKYMVTNLGDQIVMVDGNPLHLDLNKAPYKDIDHKTIIAIRDRKLIAYSPRGEPILFVKNRKSAGC